METATWVIWSIILIIFAIFIINYVDYRQNVRISNLEQKVFGSIQ